MIYKCIILLWLMYIPAYTSTKGAPAQLKNAAYPTVSDYDKLISRYRYYKPDSAIYFTNKAIALAKHNHDYNGLAAMLNQQGMIKDNLGQFDDSRQNYLNAIDLYKHTGNQKGIATETVRLGVVQMRKGNYDSAIGYFLDALKVSEQSNNTFGKMEAYLTISEGYAAQRKYDIAVVYLNKAKQIDQTIPFSNLSLNILNDYGLMYRELGQFEKAKAEFVKGIKQSNKPQYMGLNITLINNLASVYAKQGLKAASVKLQLAALAKSREIKNYLRELLTLTSLAETYGNGEPEKALFYFKQALSLVKLKGAQKQAIEILSRMAEIYHLQGKDTDAYLTKQEEHAIADKYFYQSMAKQIVNLQTEYELNKSNARVQQLNYQNTSQRLESRVIICITAGVVVLMLMFAVFFYRTRRLNGLLNKANRNLQESNSVKDKLFSVLAHDLRSPFVTIINLLTLINNDDDMTVPERKELIDMVSVTSNASLDILNNLLKWGEMQIKGIRLNPADLNPMEMIERNMAVLSATAGMKFINLRNLVAKDAVVVTDRDHFEFILRNLLSNAIKFTPEGGDVTISSFTDKARHEIQFIVADNGVGISPERVSKIFEMSNISTNGTKEEKGTSLGLLLCKEFVEANKGRIWVESRPGAGSQFIFSLKMSKKRVIKTSPLQVVETVA